MADNNGFVLKEHLFFEKKSFEDPYIETLFKGCLSFFDDKRGPLTSLMKSLLTTPVSEKETTYLLKSSATSDLFKRLDFSLMPQNPATGTIAEAKGTSYIYAKDARGGRWEKLKAPAKDKKAHIEVGKKKKVEEEDDEKRLVDQEEEKSSGVKVSAERRKQISTLIEGDETKPTEKEILLRDGSRKKVEGEATGGLFIHKEVLQGGKRGAWIITHSASGMKLVDSFKSKKDSKTAASRLRNLEDWAQSLDDLKQTELFGEIKKFANKLRDNPYAEATGKIKEKETYIKKKKDGEKRASRESKKKEKEDRATRLKKEKQKGRSQDLEVKKSYVVRRGLKKSPVKSLLFKVRRKVK